MSSHPAQRRKLHATSSNGPAVAEDDGGHSSDVPQGLHHQGDGRARSSQLRPMDARVVRALDPRLPAITGRPLPEPLDGYIDNSVQVERDFFKRPDPMYRGRTLPNLLASNAGYLRKAAGWFDEAMYDCVFSGYLSDVAGGTAGVFAHAIRAMFDDLWRVRFANDEAKAVTAKEAAALKARAQVDYSAAGHTLERYIAAGKPMQGFLSVMYARANTRVVIAERFAAERQRLADEELTDRHLQRMRMRTEADYRLAQIAANDALELYPEVVIESDT